MWTSSKCEMHFNTNIFCSSPEDNDRSHVLSMCFFDCITQMLKPLKCICCILAILQCTYPPRELHWIYSLCCVFLTAMHCILLMRPCKQSHNTNCWLITSVLTPSLIFILKLRLLETVSFFVVSLLFLICLSSFSFHSLGLLSMQSVWSHCITQGPNISRKICT